MIEADTNIAMEPQRASARARPRSQAMKPQAGCCRSLFRSPWHLSCWWTTRPRLCPPPAYPDRKRLRRDQRDDTRAALGAAAETAFAYAVVELRLGRDSGLELIKELREFHPSMRIVVATGFDSFASVALALKAGAVDYLAKPVDEGELVNALLGRTTMLPPVPETPLGLKRVCWEYIQRVFEQCDRNVTRAAQQLSMHRRTLQRILLKRAPCPRRMQLE